MAVQWLCAKPLLEATFDVTRRDNWKRVSQVFRTLSILGDRKEASIMATVTQSRIRARPARM